jgi:uncharacterized protein (UPF0548 family)
MNFCNELQLHQHEAQRLRAEYPADASLHLLLDVDLAIRRAACRVLALRDSLAARLFGARGTAGKARASLR